MVDPKRAALIKRRVMRLKSDLEDHEEARLFLELLLKEGLPFFLESGESFPIVHDDCDGDQTQTLDVVMDKVGDMHIKTNNLHHYLRFRNFFGGGMSLRVWYALRILALAIKLDERR